MLNLGSSTREFRESVKPHIARELFAPLAAAGIEIVHTDLKAADGVDVAGDILDPKVLGDLKARGFRCVLLSNLLEHVRDREAVARACELIVGSGGLILATVPSSFPFHADPIDTGFRPDPAALAGCFTRSRMLLAEAVTGRTYAEDIEARGSTLWKEIGRTFLSGLIFFARPKSFASRLHRWRWYRQRFRVSVVLMRVKAR